MQLVNFYASHPSDLVSTQVLSDQAQMRLSTVTVHLNLHDLFLVQPQLHIGSYGRSTESNLLQVKVLGSYLKGHYVVLENIYKLLILGY